MKDIFVKVCGITDLNNLEELVGDQGGSECSPDLFGFIVAKESRRFVTLEKAKELANSIPKYFAKVLVTVNLEIDEFGLCFNDGTFTHVQLHGEEDLEYVLNLRKLFPNLKIIKAVQVDENFDFQNIIEFSMCVDYFLFDAKGRSRGGNGEKFPWGKLSEYGLSVPFILSGGIGPEDAEDIKAVTQRNPSLVGIDINSGFEIAPGLKDASKIFTFLRELDLE